MTALFDSLAAYSGPIHSQARARNDIGYLAEQLAARILGVEITPITNAALCPDFRLGGLRGEIKSVGKSGQALAWKWRVEKERAAFNPSNYLYIYVRHEMTINAGSREALRDQVGKRPPVIIAATLADVLAAIGDRPHKLFSIHSNPDHGSQREGYRDGGWQFRVSKFRPEAEEFKTVPWPWLFNEITCKIQSTLSFLNAVQVNQKRDNGAMGIDPEETEAIKVPLSHRRMRKPPPEIWPCLL